MLFGRNKEYGMDKIRNVVKKKYGIWWGRNKEYGMDKIRNVVKKNYGIW